MKRCHHLSSRIRNRLRRREICVERLERRELLAFTHLNPGGETALVEELPVNFVFVGYEPNQIDLAQFAASLPAEYEPIARVPSFYGKVEPIGVEYDFEYRHFFTDEAFEDSFFAALTGLATDDGSITAAQDAYNTLNSSPALEITENYSIHAPSVEKWLSQNAPAGVDTTQNTVFFINWWGRDDFVFHTYTKAGEPDPDTGFDFSTTESRGPIAWGGTTADDEETGLGETHRIWFHDLSAGPDFWTGGFALGELPDLDGDGLDDYRMPPVWEYLTGNWQADLTHDLGLIARYVAIDLLFTPSPIYSPSLTPNRLPDKINLDLNTYQGIDGVDAYATFQKPDLLLQELSEVYPLPITTDHQDLVFDEAARESYVGTFTDVVTNEEYGNVLPFANLFFDTTLKLEELLDGPNSGQGTYTYEAVGINYAVAGDDDVGFFLGYADDNWDDGTQSYVYSVVSPRIAERGYGLTTTQIHEYGHHFGLSHPHDGYDPDLPGDFGVGDFGPAGEFFFVWTGDMVNSMMSYIDLNWDFSQFDRDNMNRYLAAAHVRAANAVAADVLASETLPQQGRSQLVQADTLIGKAQRAIEMHDYRATFHFARQAYRHVLKAAASADVEVLPGNKGRELPSWAAGEGGDLRLPSYLHSDDRLLHEERRFELVSTLLESKTDSGASNLAALDSAEIASAWFAVNVKRSPSADSTEEIACHQVQATSQASSAHQMLFAAYSDAFWRDGDRDFATSDTQRHESELKDKADAVGGRGTTIDSEGQRVTLERSMRGGAFLA